MPLKQIKIFGESASEYAGHWNTYITDTSYKSRIELWAEENEKWRNNIHSERTNFWLLPLTPYQHLQFTNCENIHFSTQDLCLFTECSIRLPIFPLLSSTQHSSSINTNQSQSSLSSHSLQNKPLVYSHEQIIRVFCEAKHILIPNQLRNVKDFEVKRLIQPNLVLECVKQQIPDSRFQNSKEEGNVNPRIRKLFLYFNQNQDSNSS